VNVVEKDLLLHVCCAPCLTSTHEELDKMGVIFSGFWHNPNIHPYTEFRKRMQTLERYTALKPIEIIYDDSYDVKGWVKRAIEIEDGGGVRCEECYRHRFKATAQKAKEMGFKRFSTTLLFSKYQKHELIKKVGEEIARDVGVVFFYHDFRPGWKRSIEICKELDIYRQGYCGCIFSEEERYCKPSSPPKVVN